MKRINESRLRRIVSEAIRKNLKEDNEMASGNDTGGKYDEVLSNKIENAKEEVIRVAREYQNQSDKNDLESMLKFTFFDIAYRLGYQDLANKIHHIMDNNFE